jgi:hypothetical protein
MKKGKIPTDKLSMSSVQAEKMSLNAGRKTSVVTKCAGLCNLKAQCKHT